MSSSKPNIRAIGNAIDPEKVQNAVEAEKLKNDSIVRQPTGRMSDDPQENEPRSNFDVAPHRIATDGGDEAMRDLLSLQPHFGQDKLLGQREWDPSAFAYLEQKRQRAIQAKVNESTSAFATLRAIHRRKGR